MKLEEVFAKWPSTVYFVLAGSFILKLVRNLKQDEQIETISC